MRYGDGVSGWTDFSCDVLLVPLLRLRIGALTYFAFTVEDERYRSVLLSCC
jgi:hypothetical protein